LDWLLTRNVLRSAERTFWLTSSERQDLEAVMRGTELPLQELRNGIQRVDHVVVPRRAAEDIEVLYLARLHPRKRPRLLAEVAHRLFGAGHKFSLKFVGPDEGEAAELLEFVAGNHLAASVRWEGAASPDATRDRMLNADVYVLPSLNEPFPMSVLEAMSVGLPVIVTDTCGLAPYIRDSGSGIVVDDTPQSLENGLRELIESSDLRRSMGQNGIQLVAEQFSISAVVDDLEKVYHTLLPKSID
jgi:glycosyltransferase involved in cell wall biosynthesis